MKIKGTGHFNEWRRVVSQTCWEKGQVLASWVSLTGGSVEEFVAEVQGVTINHARKMLETHQRFYATRSQFKGLLWAHFQAALEWDDADEWLEAASEHGWSVAEMRATRWEGEGDV